jgi:3-phosphoshikimate 1-carboxyvinyltransferase
MGERSVRTSAGRLDAVVHVPGSKSIANRALVCAALADGDTTLRDVPDGDDTAAMIAALSRLEIEVGSAGTTLTIEGGVPGRWPTAALHAELAGTTSRFLLAMAALGREPITVDGHAPLRARPFAPLLDALTELGVDVVANETAGHLPVTITGPPRGGRVALPGDVSSQFVTALMLIGPALTEGLRIDLTSPLVSRPYVELTARVMTWFGIEGVEIGQAEITIPAGRYRAAELTIEPDASSASYPLALAPVCGGRVTVPGLGLRSSQGDARFASLLAAMGSGVTRTADRTTVESGVGLRGIDVDMADISDLVPTMAVVAACAASPTRIRGVGFIRSKESDRLGDLTHELRRLGVDLDETEDGLDVRPSAHVVHGGHVATHHDHRLAMAFGVLGSRVPGVVVEDSDVVSKSWPGFWSMLDDLIR